MTNSATQIARLAGTLEEAGGLKLWSVIVTVLGDISANGRAEISGLALADVIERIGLQPQAMRVALHRLKRDGWVEGRRAGRLGYHRLTNVGLVRSKAVGNRIYSADTADCGPVYLAVLPVRENKALAGLLDDTQVLPLTARTVLVCGNTSTLPADWMVIPLADTALPDWVRAELEAAACDKDFTMLLRALGQLDPAALADPADRYALRVLVLHGWRRLVLRSEVLAESVLGPECAAARCRAQVLRILAVLPLPLAPESAR